MANVKLTKLVLPQPELRKLNPKEKKRYIMFSLMLRDLNLLQKCLVFCANQSPSDAPSRSAKTTTSVFFLKTLISKIHEMRIFFDKNNVMANVAQSTELMNLATEVNNFFSEPKIIGICSFIRNKFGFHYEYQDDVDTLIDDVLNQFTEFEIWLSLEDSGNEIFSSSNDVIIKAIFSEMTRLGFSGNDENLLDQLFSVAVRGARILREFSVSYVVDALPVRWVQKEKIEIVAPFYSEVKLPLIVGRLDEADS
jgi:hypothetical protein